MDSMPSSPTKHDGAVRRTGSLSELGIETKGALGDVPPSGSSTPPRHVSPARGMIGFSSLSRELARASLHDSASDEALTSASKPQPSSASRISIDTDGGERDEMRRSRSISNMVPSSWHEGSQYLK